MIDIEHVNATHREIGEAAVATGAGRSVLLRRSYDSPIADVWSACTSRDRLARWFGQVDGDLQLGGSFQVKDNAGGEIIACEEPRLLKVTWVLGPGMATEVEVRLSPDGDGTTLELEHSTPAEVLDELVRSYGPGGTIGVGVGWDLALVELESSSTAPRSTPRPGRTPPRPRSSQPAPAAPGDRSSRTPGAPATTTSPQPSHSPSPTSLPAPTSPRVPSETSNVDGADSAVIGRQQRGAGAVPATWRSWSLMRKPPDPHCARRPPWL